MGGRVKQNPLTGSHRYPPRPAALSRHPQFRVRFVVVVPQLGGLRGIEYNPGTHRRGVAIAENLIPAQSRFVAPPDK